MPRRCSSSSSKGMCVGWRHILRLAAPLSSMPGTQLAIAYSVAGVTDLQSVQKVIVDRVSPDGLVAEWNAQQCGGLASPCRGAYGLGQVCSVDGCSWPKPNMGKNNDVVTKKPMSMVLASSGNTSPMVGRLHVHVIRALKFILDLEVSRLAFWDGCLRKR